MVGVILPDCGGAWVPDTGGDNSEGTGEVPDVVMEQLRNHGKKGIVISGLVAWIEVQMGTEGCDIWRALAERNWVDSEVTLAKEALAGACGHLLETLVPEFKTRRQKKEKEIEDIRKAIVALKANNSMPLVLASSGMMTRCPPAWGQPATATTQDVMGKVHMLEEVMSSHMELQRKQMEILSQEVAGLKASGTLPKVPPVFPSISVDLSETPSKKRKFEDCPNSQPSYAAAVGVKGVQAMPAPVLHDQQDSVKLLQQVLQQQGKPKDRSRSPRNICYGSAKTTGENNVETLLAADVDLVASGVGKDCTNEDLSDFLKGRGIDAVAVETLTKDEVLSQVRTKTFKVTVKPSQYEAALKPEVWPYRVAVRHYRAPRRQDTTWGDQSSRAGGHINNAEQVSRSRQPHQGQSLAPAGRPQQKPGPHQVLDQALSNPVQLSNFFDLLGRLGGREVTN